MKKLLILATVAFFAACSGTSESSGVESSVKGAVKDKAAEQIDAYVDGTDQNALVKEVVKAGAKQKANEKIDETFEKAKSKVTKSKK